MKARSTARPEPSRHHGDSDRGGHGQAQQATAVADSRPEMEQQQGLLSLMAGSPRLQRKCACGAPSAAGGSCAACEEKATAASPQVLQKKLAIGAADDPLERDADRVADQVMAASAHSQVCGGPVRIQRFTGQGGGQMDMAPASVERVLASSGRPLEPALRKDMEQRFGHDFSKVQVHSDAAAGRSAQEVYARAYTVGQDIVFGAGHFTPTTREGQWLLAHELAHVVQQTSGRVSQRIARDTSADQAACPKGHLKGERQKAGKELKNETIVYLVWGTWQPGDTGASFKERTFREWIAWRFARINAQQAAAALKYSLDNIHGDAIGTPGCQMEITMDFKAMVDIRKISGEPAREKEAAEKKKAEEAERTPLGDQPGRGSQAADKAADPGAGRGTQTPAGELKGEPAKFDSGGLPSLGNFGPLSDAVGEQRFQDQYVTTRIKPDASVLADPNRAELYLQILQHYTGRAIGENDRKAAADGLDQAEIDKITDGNPMRKAITALFGQGYREFEQAGGSELEKFRLLIQTICEQFTFGNPTATHNQLEIGKGVPEKNVLGIVERSTGILFYNDLGVALASFGGVGTRDRGYISTKLEKDAWAINLANVSDPGLRELLNSLRLTFSEPARMAVAGAEVYFNNIELVNSKVQAGLAPAIKQKFLDMLPFFVGFIAGHAVSGFLMRVPNPQVASVGLTLKGLLTFSGYIMDIDFAAGATERLLSAAALLSKFSRDETNEVTKLSEGNLNAAAKIIQDMVAEIAAMFATWALGKLLRGAHKGSEQLKIECTHCDLKGSGAAEAKAPTVELKPGEAKPAELKPGEGAIPEPKAEAKPEAQPDAKPKELSAQEKAKQRLQELGVEKTRKEMELSDLRKQREALRKEYNDAIEAKNEAVQEWDAANGNRAKSDAARSKAREAKARADAASAKMEERPSDEGLWKDLKKLEGEIGIEGIKADPSSRGLLPCFSPDTLVLTPQGPRPIDQLSAGDLVWTFDFASRKRHARPILQLHRGHTLAFHRLLTDRGEIVATSQHRFWVESDLAWRTAHTLSPGEILRDADGGRLLVLENAREAVDTAATCTLSVEECHNFFVGPGALVHNEPVDVGLGGDFVIYRGTNPNPKFRGKTYIGQTTDLDFHGEARGTEMRQGEHQAWARKQLAEDAAGIKKLSGRDKAFYEFMKDATLEPIVKGIATQDQADYLEQRNIDLERQVSGKDNVLNRRNEITKESHMKEVVESIKADPAVKAKGYCP